MVIGCEIFCNKYFYKYIYDCPEVSKDMSILSLHDHTHQAASKYMIVCIMLYQWFTCGLLTFISACFDLILGVVVCVCVCVGGGGDSSCGGHTVDYGSAKIRGTRCSMKTQTGMMA